MCNRVDRMQGLGFGGEARAGFGFAIGLRLKTKASQFGRIKRGEVGAGVAHRE